VRHQPSTHRPFTSWTDEHSPTRSTSHFLVVFNDPQYLQNHLNGRVTNAVVLAIIGLAFVLAVVSLSLEIAEGETGMRLVRDFLDEPVELRDRTPVGRVDGVVAEMRHNVPPRIVAIELGAAVLAGRLPWLGPPAFPRRR
jgi:hypothetical protein